MCRVARVLGLLANYHWRELRMGDRISLYCWQDLGQVICIVKIDCGKTLSMKHWTGLENVINRSLVANWYWYIKERKNIPAACNLQPRVCDPISVRLGSHSTGPLPTVARCSQEGEWSLLSRRLWTFPPFWTTFLLISASSSRMQVTGAVIISRVPVPTTVLDGSCSKKGVPNTRG